MIKSYWWIGVGGPHDLSVSPSPLRTNLGFELYWYWNGLGLGIGLGGLGTKGLGPGLDKNSTWILNLKLAWKCVSFTRLHFQFSYFQELGPQIINKYEMRAELVSVQGAVLLLHLNRKHDQ